MNLFQFTIIFVFTFRFFLCAAQTNECKKPQYFACYEPESTSGTDSAQIKKWVFEHRIKMEASSLPILFLSDNKD
ncbi:MAG: hypothetical protein R2850_12250, partial [Bacteroidia bacterium]